MNKILSIAILIPYLFFEGQSQTVVNRKFKVLYEVDSVQMLNNFHNCVALDSIVGKTGDYAIVEQQSSMILSLFHVESGSLEGTLFTYHRNGQLESIKQYNNGVRYGRSYLFDDRGNLGVILEYVNGYNTVEWYIRNYMKIRKRVFKPNGVREKRTRRKLSDRTYKEILELLLENTNYRIL